MITGGPVSQLNKKIKRQADYYVSRRFHQDMTHSSDIGEIFDEDASASGPDKKSMKTSDTADDSNLATNYLNNSIDLADSSEIDTSTQPSTTTSETELNLLTDFQEHKSVARSRKPLRHYVIEDFRELHNNMDNSQYEPKNWHYGEEFNSDNSNNIDVLADWSHKHSPKLGLHSNYETQSNHQHHSQTGDSWQANDSSDGDRPYIEWSNSNSKGISDQLSGVGLEDELAKSHKKIHFAKESHGIGEKSLYFKDWAGSQSSSNSWGGSDSDFKHGEPHAVYYGKWNGAHLEPTNWERSHFGGAMSDVIYVTGAGTAGGSHYNKNDIFRNGKGLPSYYNWGRSRSDS